MGKKIFFVYSSLILAMIFWGFSFIGTKICLVNLSPITLILSRLVVSVIFLFLLTKSLGILENIKKKDLKWFFLIAFFEPLLYFIGETYGLNLVSSTLGAVLIATIPLFVPWAALIIFRENISILNMLGILFSIVGILLVIMNKDFSFNASVPGILLLMLAVFSAVGYSMVLRHIAHSYSPITIVTWQNFFGLIAFTPIFFLVDFPDFHLTDFSSKIIYTIIGLGIFPSSLSYMFFAYAVRDIGISKASIFSNMIPVITALFSFLIMGDSLPFIRIIGILIVIFALTISQFNIFSFSEFRKKILK